MSTKIPVSQTEVWDWKQKAFEKLQKLPREKWMEAIRKSTREMTEKLNRTVQLKHK